MYHVPSGPSINGYREMSDFSLEWESQKWERNSRNLASSGLSRQIAMSGVVIQRIHLCQNLIEMRQAFKFAG
jgi:hypothetical protein